MKKLFSIFLSFLFFINFVVCFSAKEKVVIGLDINVMPMGFLDEKGEIVGFDIDLARAVFEKLGKEPIFQPINWDSKEQELDSGKIDAIFNGMSYTKERDLNMELSKSYMKNSQIVVFSGNNKDVKDIDYFKGKSICVQKGSTGAEALKKHRIYKDLKEVVELENMMDCLLEVENKNCDATVLDEVVFKYYAKEKGLSNSFSFLKEPISKEDYVIGFKKGNKKLKEEVEGAIYNLIENKQAEKISKRWFSENLVNLKEVDKSYYSEGEKTDKQDSFSELLRGLLVSLKLFFFCLLFSLPLGLLICFLRVKENIILNIIIDIYTLLMRGTPLLLQILFIFYGLPMIFPNFPIKDRFLIGLAAFIINYCAYFVEIFRGSFKSIEKGQFEAIKALKIPKFKAIKKIVLPQMLKVCLPSLCNETITLVKDTALIFSIGVVELLTTAKNLVNKNVSIVPYIFAAALYLSIGFIINLIFKFFEKKLKF